jgi:hypothetical protein
LQVITHASDALPSQELSRTVSQTLCCRHLACRCTWLQTIFAVILATSCLIATERNHEPGWSITVCGFVVAIQVSSSDPLTRRPLYIIALSNLSRVEVLSCYLPVGSPNRYFGLMRRTLPFLYNRSFYHTSLLSWMCSRWTLGICSGQPICYEGRRRPRAAYRLTCNDLLWQPLSL